MVRAFFVVTANNDQIRKNARPPADQIRYKW